MYYIIITLYLLIYLKRAKELIQDLRNRMMHVYKNCNSQSDSFILRLLLAEWTRVCKHSMTSTDLYIQFAERVCIYCLRDIMYLFLLHLDPSNDNMRYRKTMLLF